MSTSRQPNTNRPSTPYLSRSVWLTYLILFTIAIPWYWPAESQTRWLGLPAWVVIAIATSALISIFTAWLLCRSWPDELAGQDQEGS